MNIAIDIDDTLAEYIQGFLMYHNNRYGTSMKKSELTQYNFSTLLGLSSVKELTERMIEFSKTEDFGKLKPLQGSQDIVKELGSGNNLYVITSRPEYMKDASITWLEQYYPSLFSDYFFTNQFAAKKGAIVKTKTEVCKELDATILIEDSFNHAKEAIDNDIRAILINNPWNISLKNEKIERVNNWEDIKKRIIV